MRRYLILIVAAVFLVSCGNEQDVEDDSNGYIEFDQEAYDEVFNKNEDEFNNEENEIVENEEVTEAVEEKQNSYNEDDDTYLILGNDTLDVNKEMNFEHGNLNVELQSVEVDGDELSLGFWWNHWASNEDIHFSYFAYPSVTQNGEHLEDIYGENTLLRQTAKGVDSRVDLTYQLIDDSPVTIKIITTEDSEEDSIEIELD